MRCIYTKLQGEAKSDDWGNYWVQTELRGKLKSASLDGQYWRTVSKVEFLELCPLCNTEGECTAEPRYIGGGRPGTAYLG